MSLESRFLITDAFLLQWQWLWRDVPFKQPELPWFKTHPRWKFILNAIDDRLLQHLTADVDALYAFARGHLQVDIDPCFYRLDGLPMSTWASEQPAPDGIATRKWQQIQAFTTALRQSRDETSMQERHAEVVEWCAGKGHLSRALLQQELFTHAVGLERDAALIDSGVTMARRDKIALQLHQQNVLHDSVANYCTPGSHHIALHACGNLHVSMLHHCCAERVQSVDLVPCCYHKVDDVVYQPLSLRARQSTLQLDDDALKLALQETVTAPANARRIRERLQQWRLGFDALQRELRGSDSYLPVPSMAGAMANSSFRDFCRHCADLKQVELAAGIDYDHFEAVGRTRFCEVSRYDLVRQLFRRPVELWLVLDRCLFLVEHGYAVRLSEFCARELTPRNLWIHASLKT